MADVTIRGPDCDEEGERGHRGRRGPTGPTGSGGGGSGTTGATGPTGPGGSGSSGNPQAFRFTATGAEGSDFVVLLPAPRASDVYHVEATLAGAALIYGIDCPDILAGDRTTLQFRVVTTFPVTAGDQFDFVVLDTVT